MSAGGRHEGLRTALGGTVGHGTAVTGLLIGPGVHFWLRRARTPAGHPAPLPARPG